MMRSIPSGQGLSRRSVLLGGGALAVPLLVGRPASARRPLAGATASSTAGSTSPLQPDLLVPIGADPAFTFAHALGERGTGSGESSPIADAYWMGAYEVTNAEWLAYVEASRSAAPSYWIDGLPPNGKDDHPVLMISAVEADAYCTWLGTVFTDWKFRPPTEAEWEHAARGTVVTDYPWGDAADTTYADGVLTSRYNYNGVVAAHALATCPEATFNDDSARAGETVALSEILSVGPDGSVNGWVDHTNGTGFTSTDVYELLAADGGWTTPVTSYPDAVSATGLYDLAGNVWEWTSSVITATNGAEAGDEVNAVRGGSWYATSRSCTTSLRGEGRAPDGGYATIGLRVAAVQA